MYEKKVNTTILHDPWLIESVVVELWIQRNQTMHMEG